MAVLSYGQLTDLWRSAGGDPLQAGTAAAIALAESGGNTAAIHNTAHPNLPGYRPPSPGNLPEYSIGLWQINQLAHPAYTTAQLLTPAGNVAAARAISGNGGNWNPWSTFTSGAYKQYVVGVPGGGPPTDAGPATGLSASAKHSLSGWHKLSVSSGVALPTSLTRSGQSRRAALRALSQGTKVAKRGR